MRPIERVNNRIHALPVDKIPNFNIYMGFGARAIGANLASYFNDYKVLCAANLYLLENCQVDIVQAISDPYREASDLGVEIEFPYDGLPLRKKPIINCMDDANRINFSGVPGGRRTNDRLEAIRYFKEKVGDEVPIMGWVEGPLALLNTLRGDSNLMIDLYDNVDWLYGLLERCLEFEIEFARQQVRAGATIIGLGDSIASLLSPAMYRSFALPYEKRIFEAVHTEGAMCRLHICGNISRILKDVIQTDADFIDVDWMVDFKTAADVFGNRAIPVGNFDPVGVMLQGTPADVEREVLNCLKAGGERCFNAAGCEIPLGTPLENLEKQNEVLNGHIR